MIEFEKMRTLIAKNPCNLITHWIIEIFSIPRNAYIVIRDQNKVVFYVNDYIN